MATYLITQASGQQSQWAITHLVAAGATVHALVRNPQKLSATLEHPKVKVFKGESTDFDAVFEAARGCTGAFLNTFPIPGLEAQQAQTIVDACKKAGVETVVAATTVFTGERTMWDDDATKKAGLHAYYTSKSEVEAAVRTAGFKAYTILRPGFIHFDYLIPNVHGNFPALPKSGELVHAYNDEARMPHTDASDIGKYAAAALQDPAKFGGEEIELGYEALTIYEARDIVSRVSGRDVGVRRRTAAEIEEAKMTVPGQAFHLWMNVKDVSSVATTARDVQAKFGIPFTSLEAALSREKERLLECIPA